MTENPPRTRVLQFLVDGEWRTAARYPADVAHLAWFDQQLFEYVGGTAARLSWED